MRKAGTSHPLGLASAVVQSPGAQRTPSDGRTAFLVQPTMTNQQKALALELFAGTAFVLAANTISLALALTLTGLFALLAAWTISQNRS